MSKEEQDITQFIKVNKKQAQFLINFISTHFQKEEIIDEKLNVIRDKDFVLFPLLKNEKNIKDLSDKLKSEVEFELILKESVPRPDYKYRTLQEALSNEIPEIYYKYIPKSYDIIGDIASIEFDRSIDLSNEDVKMVKIKIAKALVNQNKNIKTVYEKRSEIRGEYRLRDLGILYGDDKSETIHKENKCVFKLDVKKTFFSPRLVYERNRIANSDIKEKEIIIDLFAGVGPFSIQIAKINNATIYSFDVNPNAFEYLKENISLNKLKGEIYPYNMDIKELLDPLNEIGKTLQYKADRIIMNLPEDSIKFLDVTCKLVKKTGGIIHIYQFCEKPAPIERAINKLSNELKKSNCILKEVLNSKIVKTYSPISELVVIDAFIKLK